MKKNSKHAFTQKDIENWDKLYLYVKELFGYDEHMRLPKHFLLRIKGMSKGQYIVNNNTANKKEYSFEVIRYAFMISSPDIKRALKNNKFKNEEHKINHVLKIVEKNLDDVNERVIKRNNEMVKV